MRILIVDDNELIAKALKRWFDRYGFQTILANGVNEALDRMQLLTGSDMRVDLIVSDVDMPDGTGFELADRLNDCLGYKPMFMFMTTMPEEWKRSEASHHGGGRLYDKMELKDIVQAACDVAIAIDKHLGLV